MIKNVIFDLGDVLINNNLLEYIKTLGYSREKTQELYQALSTDSLWHDKDIGIYESYVDCIPIFQKHHPNLINEIVDFFQDSWMKKVYTPIKENLVLYKKAQELGYDIFFLTNYSVDGFAYLEENYDFIRTAKGKIVSSMSIVANQNVKYLSYYLKHTNLTPRNVSLLMTILIIYWRLKNWDLTRFYLQMFRKYCIYWIESRYTNFNMYWTL